MSADHSINKPSSRQTPADYAAIRIIDANLDRTAEGLRVVMDIIRFGLDDATGSEQLRRIRHQALKIVRNIPRLAGLRLESRESEQDVGKELGRGVPGKSLAEIFSANIHRAQESVRCLEEVIRSFSPRAADDFSTLRYELYTFEKKYHSRIILWSLQQKLDFDLYVVTSPEFQKGRSLQEVAEKAVRAGAGCIQLRAKSLGKKDLLKEARQIRKITRDHGATFIINDHLDIALASEADGVHLGQEDLPLPEARKIVGPGMILGASTHSVEQALEAEAQGASYINVGPVFATQTKTKTAPPVGTDLITQVKKKVKIPQTCMGGIKPENIREVVLAGAERPAVVTAVVGAEDIENAARNLLQRIQKAKEERN